MVHAMQNAVRSVIEENGLIAAGDHVVLGFSGGPDSLCLLDILCALREEMGFSLSCVHVNHGLRPGEAEEDQAFCEKICGEWHVPCEVSVADCRAAARSLGLTEEEAGRRLRYAAFSGRAAALAQQGAARVRIAVAQNRNDQAETVLQRLIRGTGTDGLAGMDYLRQGEDGFAVIRPLLDTDRADIEAYLAARGLTPRRDHTNEENEYVRNRIRNELIPYLAAHFNPNITEALTRAAANTREDSRYLKECAAKQLFDAQLEAGEIPLLAAEEGAVRLQGTAGSAGLPVLSVLRMDLSAVQTAPLPLRHRMLRMAFAAVGLVQDIAAVHLAAMDQLIEEGRTSSLTTLPGGYALRVRYGLAECLAPAALREENRPAEGAEADTASGAASCSARVLTRAELLAEIRRTSGSAWQDADGGAPQGALSDSEAIRAYIYSKNFSGAGEASCILDADKAAHLLTANRPADDLPDLIEFRTRRPGDRLPLKEGSKSIQDYMVDEKIPKDRRNRILLAVCDGTVLMVTVGMVRPRCAAGCTAGPETERFLLLEMAMYV